MKKELPQIRRAKAVIRDLLTMIPYPSCEQFHHSKKNQHSLFEVCPLVELIKKRISAAEKFLDDHV